MKKVVIGAMIFVVVALIFLVWSQTQETPTASLKFLGYSSDTNGVKVAQLGFTNGTDRPLHYFCGRLNDPTTIAYFLKNGGGLWVTNTFSLSKSSVRLMPREQIIFSIPLPANETRLNIGIPYIRENGPLRAFLGEMRERMSKQISRTALTAPLDMP